MDRAQTIFLPMFAEFIRSNPGISVEVLKELYRLGNIFDCCVEGGSLQDNWSIYDLTSYIDSSAITRRNSPRWLPFSHFRRA